MINAPAERRERLETLAETLDRVEVPSAQAGDIIAFTGIDKLNISDTLCDPGNVEALPALTVDEPTVSMTPYETDAKKAALLALLLLPSFCCRCCAGNRRTSSSSSRCCCSTAMT